MRKQIGGHYEIGAPPKERPNLENQNSKRVGRLRALNTESNAHAATDAEGRKTFFRAPALHFKQQRVENTAARGSDRMANGNRPAVDVYDLGVPAHLFVYGTCLSSEGLVGFDKVQITHAPAGFVECFTACINWADTHDGRVETDGCVRRNAREWLNAAFFGIVSAHQKNTSCTIIEARSVGRKEIAQLF